MTASRVVPREEATRQARLFRARLRTPLGQAGSGLIDDVRIYDRALSAAEIQALYRAGQ